MTRKGILVAAMCVLAVGASGGGADAGEPTDRIKGGVDRVLKILDDPGLKGDTKVAERRAAVRKVAGELFAFDEIARRALGRHWQARSEKEREEFTAVFGELLERSYFGRVDQYGGERIQWGAEKVEGDQAAVASKIVTKNGSEIPIQYRMLRRDDRWLVYDVVTEGVSLVGNYRTQFDKVIQAEGYPELIRKLREKQSAMAVGGGPSGGLPASPRIAGG
jgi:phospholipid transport system substrate-binding protein